MFGDYARIAEAREWIPLGQLSGIKNREWHLAYGHAPGIGKYKHRLAFHRGKEPVKNVTTTNYFELLLENPETQLPRMARILNEFNDDGDFESLPLGALWRGLFVVFRGQDHGFYHVAGANPSGSRSRFHWGQS